MERYLQGEKALKQLSIDEAALAALLYARVRARRERTLDEIPGGPVFKLVVATMFFYVACAAGAVALQETRPSVFAACVLGFILTLIVFILQNFGLYHVLYTMVRPSKHTGTGACDVHMLTFLYCGLVAVLSAAAFTGWTFVEDLNHGLLICCSVQSVLMLVFLLAMQMESVRFPGWKNKAAFTAALKKDA